MPQVRSHSNQQLFAEDTRYKQEKSAVTEILGVEIKLAYNLRRFLLVLCMTDKPLTYKEIAQQMNALPDQTYPGGKCRQPVKEESLRTVKCRVKKMLRETFKTPIGIEELSEKNELTQFQINWAALSGHLQFGGVVDTALSGESA